MHLINDAFLIYGVITAIEVYIHKLNIKLDVENVCYKLVQNLLFPHICYSAKIKLYKIIILSIFVWALYLFFHSTGRYRLRV
jgi:hypothetical protein